MKNISACTSHIFITIGVFCAFVASTLLSSCEEQLEIAPVSYYSGDNVFTTPDRVESAILGVYRSYKSIWISGKLYSYLQCDTDEAYMSGAADDNDWRGIVRYGIKSTNNQMHNTYRIIWEGIERANICCNEIPKMELYTSGSEKEKQDLRQLYGEALTLRAMMYLDLVRMWGDMPYRTTASYAGEDIDLKRVPRDTIYDRSIKDVLMAVEMIPWEAQLPPPASERLTKEGAKGMLARICLTAAGYSLYWDLETGANLKMRKRDNQKRIGELYKIARDQTYDVIYNQVGSHDLLPKYEDVFKNYAQKLYDKETMFQLSNYGINSNDRVAYENGIIIHEKSIYGKAGSGFMAPPTYYYAFDALDTRRDLAICNHQVDASSQFKLQTLSSIGPGKWRMYWRNTLPLSPLKTDFNWVILRYSDVLLMFAEADNEVNSKPSTQAIECFEKVRKRAFSLNANKIGVTPTDYAGFFQAIVNERYLELGFEGNRKYDLIRWNLLKSRLNKVKYDFAELAAGRNPFPNVSTVPADMYAELKTYPTPPLAIPMSLTAATGFIRYDWRKSIKSTINFANNFTENQSELFPIPERYMENQTELKQHPGHTSHY